MTTMIGNSVAVVGTLGILLAVVDFFLPPAQKERLRDGCIAAWCWLDGLRLSDLKAILRRNQTQAIITAVAALGNAVAWMYVLIPLALAATQSRSAFLLSWLFGLVWAYFFCHRPFLRLLLSRTSWRGYFGTLMLATVLVWGVNLVLGCWAVPYMKTWTTASGPPVMVSRTTAFFHWVAVCWVMILNVTLAVSLAWFAGIEVARAILKGVKFTLHRLIDYPKGVVLGLSVLLLALGAFIGDLLKVGK